MASGISVEQSQNPEQQQSQQGTGASRSKLVQRLLSATPNLPAFVNDLIQAQAVTVAGTEAAGFMLERQGEEAILKLIAHIRPDGAGADVRQQAVQAFQEIIKPCVEQQKDGAIEVGPAGGGEIQFCLVTLLRNDTDIVGVSAVITKCLDTERAKQRLMSMQLVAGYFDMFSLKRSSEQSKAIAVSHQHVLQAATAVSTSDGFDNAAKGLCNELATRAHAARVTLGWRKGNNVKVRAISHTEKFDKKQELVTQLERVMEECADQEAPVHFDPTGGGTENVTREAQAFSRANGGNSVIALPLRKGGEVEGALVVELLPGQKLDPSAAQGLMIAADLLAPQLYDRFENDRWLVTKAGLSIRNVAEGIIGPRHMLAKVVTVLVAGALAFVFLYKPMYHVGATFQFVADERRVISAPIDQAHIKQVNKRPGDAVKAGDVLLQLDDSDLKVQKAQALAEVARAASEMHKHRGTEGEEALANISEAERDKAMAQVQLIQSRIDKCRVVSPVDGKVLTGDWWHKVQTPVKVGEELFVVAKGGDLRAEIKVADRDIQDVNVGDVGKLAVTSLPDDTHGFAITSIVGNGEPVEGENVFKVYADVKTQRPEWLPGMAGEARIDAGHRSVAWIWTHRLVDYVKMKLWL